MVTSSGQISSWRFLYSSEQPGFSFILKAYFSIYLLHIDHRRGKAITDINKAPITIDITIPGTFRSPRPNVTSPITKAAIITPGIEPDPPRMLTPPRTTIVTISSSQPKAIDGLVEQPWYQEWGWLGLALAASSSRSTRRCGAGRTQRKQAHKKQRGQSRRRAE